MSGPGGCKVFEKACGGRRRGGGLFPGSSPETTGFLHKAENVLENVINIRVLFSPLSPSVSLPLFLSLFLLFSSVIESILKCN